VERGPEDSAEKVRNAAGARIETRPTDDEALAAWLAKIIVDEGDQPIIEVCDAIFPMRPHIAQSSS
jgi:hypothetical protein